MGQLRFTGGAENIFTRTRGPGPGRAGDAETGPRGPRIRRCAGRRGASRAPPLPGWLCWAHVPVPVINGLVSKHCCFSVLKTDQE